jgi:uncharacterized protein YdeI (YjbR/CyaY-like superfamily)
MGTNQKTQAFLAKQEQWKDELHVLRAIFNSTELVEEIKWGAPAYTIHKKNVVGMMGFKNHLGIWFHQGVFLKDPHNILINAQEGKTKSLRQFKIFKGQPIQTEILKAYTLEAIQNSKDGKEMIPSSKKKAISLVLTEALENDDALHTAYNKLTPGKRNEYATYISEAKRETTKQTRLEKSIPLILKGVGLNNAYKNK